MATSTTVKGSSSTANGSGYLALEIKTLHNSLKPQFSTGGLISVPDHVRKMDEQAFTPSLISIGPIHCSNAEFQTMKNLKVLFCKSFIKRANIELDNLLMMVKARENDIRSYYKETIVSSISSVHFVAMIVVDGIFILEFFWRQFNKSFLKDEPVVAEWMRSILKFDLVLLENQLPFFVLEMLFKEANFTIEPPLDLKKLASDFFDCYNIPQIDFCSLGLEIEHFTDLIRLFYISERLIGGNLPERKSGWAKLSYSVTQLHEVGVNFVVSTGCYNGCRCFLDMRFDLNRRVLEIPRIILSDEGIRLFRNIIALEQSLYLGSSFVTDFFVILNLLIKTSKDVELLYVKGILVNHLGDSNVAASAVHSLNTKILGGYMNEKYWKICEDLNKSYEKLWYEKLWYEQLWYLWRAQWHGWRETLLRQYFSTPWRATSTIGAIILLVLTAIQTICSLKSTKW